MIERLASMPPGLRRLLSYGAVLVAAVVALRFQVARPLWYDEALTVMEFLGCDDFRQVYANYSIPNNHIAFNLGLLAWARITSGVLPLGDLSFRIFGLTLGVATLVVMLWCWRRRLGGMGWLAVLLLTLSPAFAVYAVGIRGYQLGFLAILLAWECGRRYRNSGSRWLGAAYLAAALVAVGTMPTNLAALGLIYLMPRQRRECGAELLRPRRLWLAAAACLAFVAFYLPLAPKLWRALTLREGWESGVGAVIHLYGAWLLSFLPLGLLAVVAVIQSCGNRQRQASGKWAYGMVLIAALFPVAVMLVRYPAPFPRVFYPFWPLWLYLLACGARRTQALARHRWGQAWGRLLPGLCLLPVMAWGWLLYETAGWCSMRMTPVGAQDDYFQPYFVAADFRPFQTMEQVLAVSGGEPGRVFLDSGADPLAIIYYGKVRRGGRISEDHWGYDRPGRQWVAPPPPVALWLVVRDAARARALGLRFARPECSFVADCGYQQIWRIAED